MIKGAGVARPHLVCPAIKRKKDMETLEGRFWFNDEKPILFIISDEMINANAEDFEIVNVDKSLGIEEIIQKIKYSPVDAVYTDIVNFDLFRAIIVAGAVLYIPEEVEGMKTWKVKKFGRTVYSIGGVRKSKPRQEIKRVMDVAGALVGLTIFGISYPFVSAAIKKEDGGPAIYKQRRVGYNGREFDIYKYRSMRTDADDIKKNMAEQNEMQGQYMFKMENDPRITKIGSFLRKTSIDELPQFINVLKGDMSLVGTRPPIDTEVSNYHARHKIRLSCKPGITGSWQTHGRNKITNFEDVVDIDKRYIMSESTIEDMNILLKTVSAVVNKEGE